MPWSFSGEGKMARVRRGQKRSCSRTYSTMRSPNKWADPFELPLLLLSNDVILFSRSVCAEELEMVFYTQLSLTIDFGHCQWGGLRWTIKSCPWQYLNFFKTSSNEPGTYHLQNNLILQIIDWGILVVPHVATGYWSLSMHLTEYMFNKIFAKWNWRDNSTFCSLG